MTLYVIGMNHTSAPIEVRESVAIPTVRLRDTLRSLREEIGIQEVVLLSTCN
jgi:glutamyl-tRNA reductase